MWGYGLRYTHGIFRQLLDSRTGAQLEVPDPWLLGGENPWEICRTDISYRVRFYGTCERQGGKGKAIWYGGQEVNAVSVRISFVRLIGCLARAYALWKVESSERLMSRILLCIGRVRCPHSRMENGECQ